MMRTSVTLSGAINDRAVQDGRCGVKIISAKEAKALGLKRYFNGLPCPQGHVDERFVRTRKCRSCSKKSSLDYYYGHGAVSHKPYYDPEKRKTYYLAHREKIIQKKRNYYLANREKIIEKSKKRYHEKYRGKYNEQRKRNLEKDSERKRRYRSKNIEKILAKDKKYRETHQETIQKYKERTRKGRLALQILERLGIEI